MKNEAMVLTKLKNIYIMLLDSIMNDDIDKVDHFLDDNLAKQFRQLVKSNITDNVYQCYDLLNISNISLLNETDKILTAVANVRYVDYKTDRTTGKVVSGDNSTILRFSKRLTFRKNVLDGNLVNKCPNCGANLNINVKSFCDYCGKPIDERYSPLVLVSIE